jgi:hypothetical protein
MDLNTKIYVKLLEEGIDVKRPVNAKHCRDNIYEILPDDDDNDEVWEFLPGTIVKCEWTLTSDGEKVLLAVEKVNQ